MSSLVPGAESGIKTFRDSNGLWEGHNVMDVATPEGWYRNPELVLDFTIKDANNSKKYNLLGPSDSG
jgi:NAD-dependent deacetylase